MENVILDPIEEQYARIQASKKSETQKRKVEYDVKNYLNVKLSGSESEKKITIRILKLTPDSKTPFAEVHTHYLPSSKKTFICTKLTEDLPKGTDKNCPFCDIREQAKIEQKGADPQKWEKLKEIYKQNASMLNYIVRVVDRGDESFGIKFWKMSQATYESIYDIYTNLKEDGNDLFDVEKGFDLVLTLKKKDGKSKITNISAKTKSTPLADSTERIYQLVNDEKVWTDVYGIKPFEYLEIMINGGTPFFDKSLMKWIKKEDVKNDDDEEDGEIEEESTQSESYQTEDDLPF